MNGTVKKANGAGVFTKLAIDIGPLIVFFVVNGFAPVPQALKIFYATGAFMVAMMAAMLVSQIVYRHISPLLWFSGIMVVALGGITLWLHNETFIKIKPTLYYLLVAALLLFGMRTGRNLLKMVMDSAYPGLSDRGWHLLTRNWIAFFVVLAIANEAVWRTQSTDFWVAFKLWGVIPATFIFILANVPMLMRHGLNSDEVAPDASTPPE
jgi:intracellular septation protein